MTGGPAAARRYAVSHLTEFVYDAPVEEAVTELRKRPLDAGVQRCLGFRLDLAPAAAVRELRDAFGNHVAYFRHPGRHRQLAIGASSLVEVEPPAPLPERCGEDGWRALDALVERQQPWPFLLPSRFARPSEALAAFAREVGAGERADDPLAQLRRLSGALYRALAYAPRSTRVDSPIDEALGQRRGVCQDFTHVLIALARGLRIPCRYVSGYLFHPRGSADRSPAGASHAWAEALLPELGWVGFDPTNDLLAGERHLRVAVGRDYADVPPVRGAFKGETAGTMRVEVEVSERPAASGEEPEPALPTAVPLAAPPVVEPPAAAAGAEQQ